MVEHKYLKQVRYDKGLKLLNEEFAHSYRDLIEKLQKITEKDFQEHLQKNNNHYINWINDNYKDEELINQLKKEKTKKKYLEIITKHIQKLEQESQELKNLINQKEEIKQKKEKTYQYLWITIYALLILVLLLQHTYVNNKITRYEQELKQEQKHNQELYEQTQKTITDHEETIQTLETKEQRIEQLETLTKTLETNTTSGPEARIREQDITITKEGILIKIQEPLFAKFTDTQSMHPTLNKDTKAIQITPTKKEDINIGDIISYEKENKIIIHRVINIQEDEEGWYAITKGDNLPKEDREKVRYEQIKRILIAIIY